jgi:hypothetical protein
MNTQNKIKLLAVLTAMIAMSASAVSTVQAEEELNTNDFEFTVHITDIIDHFTYGGMSNMLTNNERSFEDQDVMRLIIQDTNYYAVYNNDYNNNFVFAGIYENGA